MKKKVVIGFTLIVFIISLVCIALVLFKKEKNVNEEEKDEKRVSIKDNLEFALGGSIPSLNDFIESDDGRIEIYLNDEIYDTETLDTIGEYKVKVYLNEEVYETSFNVFDKEAPVLKLKNVTITEGAKYSVADFIDSCVDNSKEECTFEIRDDKNYTTNGEYKITIVAKDASGNEVEDVATLIITKEKPKKVETKKEVTTEKREGKYGVTENVTLTTTWDVYSDGTIKNKQTKESIKYDYSSFNAKAKDLLPEAKENRKKYASIVNDILNKTNEYRAEVGASPLTLDEDLTLEAMARAIESSYTNKWDHTRPDGSMCFSISDELGMKEFWGENLAWGQKNGISAVNWWRNSPGHYANMTRITSTKLGVGVIKFGGKYWYVQVFAQ